MVKNGFKKGKNNFSGVCALQEVAKWVKKGFKNGKNKYLFLECVPDRWGVAASVDLSRLPSQLPPPRQCFVKKYCSQKCDKQIIIVLDQMRLVYLHSVSFVHTHTHPFVICCLIRTSGCLTEKYHIAHNSYCILHHNQPGK